MPRTPKEAAEAAWDDLKQKMDRRDIGRIGKRIARIGKKDTFKARNPVRITLDAKGRMSDVAMTEMALSVVTDLRRNGMTHIYVIEFGTHLARFARAG